MTTHYSDIKEVVHLDLITCEECRELVGIALLNGDDMTCGTSRGDHNGTGRCTNMRTLEMHECPFDADVHNDPEPHCYCCEDCQGECAMDI